MIFDIVKMLFPVLDKIIPDVNERDRIKRELTVATLENEKEYIQSVKDIVIAEAQGESWMQRNWRPGMSWMLMGLWTWNWVARPLVDAAFGTSLEAVPSEELTFLTTVWAGAYGIGRTFEKTGSTLKIGG